MPIKNLFHRFQPVPLYIVLILSICYFSVQLILSHFSHALTLLMASYHMLCNIFALAGSIVTIKHNELHNEYEKLYMEAQLKLSSPCIAIENKSDSKNGVRPPVTAVVQLPEEEARLSEIKRRELKTRNTFGWARIEILTMLIVCITLASLSFSLLVEALQTLIHIDHQDSMHYPVHVMILGFVGLLLNGFTYLLIGGYTLHQGNFLHINPKGNVVVEPSNITVEGNDVLNKQNVNHNHSSDLQLKEDLKSELGTVHYRTRRQGSTELLRDVSSTLFVIVCAVIIYYAKDKDHTAKFIDPILAIFSCVMVVALSYPYMKESCLILLQTIPGSIDMDNFERTLVTKFPQIVSYHDLHIWQLSSHKYVATVHIIFENSKLYEKTIEDVRTHFQDHKITHVTIQPEFQSADTSLSNGSNASTECLMHCQNPDCMDKVCCFDAFSDLKEVSVCPTDSSCTKNSSKKHQHNHKHGHGHGHGHDPKHGHGHGHGHGHDYGHGHGHGNGHGHGHGNGHENGHEHAHDHEHSHKHKGHKHADDHTCSKDVQEVSKDLHEVSEADKTKEEMTVTKNKILAEEKKINEKVIEQQEKESEDIRTKLSATISNPDKCQDKLESRKAALSNAAIEMAEPLKIIETTTSIEIKKSSNKSDMESGISDSYNTKC